jgi:hypothetical protein
MRHQTANRTACEEVAGNAAEEPFAQAAVAVGSGHEPIYAFLLSEIRQLFPSGFTPVGNDARISANHPILGEDLIWLSKPTVDWIEYGCTSE